MTILVRSLKEEEHGAWDEFCHSTFQGTFLHTRRFLSYHGDRFVDQSLVLEEDGEWVGILPAAISPSNNNWIVSHPGATYGGLLHKGRLQGSRMVEALIQIQKYYAEQGFSRLIYKAVPSLYHRFPANDDLYALFRVGGMRSRCDLSSAIDLSDRLPVSVRRKRSLKRAVKEGVQVIVGKQYLQELWNVLRENLSVKHNVEPTHSLNEIALLFDRFPENIQCVCGLLEQRVVAGVILFNTSTTSHAQYIASSNVGYEVSALDAVFEHCINEAQNNNKSWFDFGISNEDQGKTLNDGLYKFKCEFGGGGIVHEFYELDFSSGGLNGAA